MDQAQLDAKIASHADSDSRFILKRIPLPDGSLARAQCLRAIAANLSTVAQAIEDASSTTDPPPSDVLVLEDAPPADTDPAAPPADEPPPAA
jgi:hypothetical protein